MRSTLVAHLDLPVVIHLDNVSAGSTYKLQLIAGADVNEASSANDLIPKGPGSWEIKIDGVAVTVDFNVFGTFIDGDTSLMHILTTEFTVADVNTDGIDIQLTANGQPLLMAFTLEEIDFFEPQEPEPEPESGNLFGFENLIGSQGNDTLTGNDQNNMIDGLGGIDMIEARGANDTITVSSSESIIDGGAGNDTVVFSNTEGGVNVDIGTFTKSFTGGDPGEGLDLTGNIVYAVDFDRVEEATLINGVEFIEARPFDFQNPAQGVNINPDDGGFVTSILFNLNLLSEWDLGNSENDLALNALMNDFMFSFGNLSIDLDVEAGKSYELLVLGGQPEIPPGGFTVNDFDVIIEGETFGTLETLNENVGALASATFTMEDDQLNIDLVNQNSSILVYGFVLKEISADTVLEPSTITNIENVVGTSSADQIFGSIVANRLDGNGGADTIVALKGDDVILVPDVAFALADGGQGFDSLSFENASAAIFLDLPSLGEKIVDIERFVGSDHNETMMGDDNDNIFVGGLGNDMINGGDNSSDTVDYSDFEDNGLEIDLNEKDQDLGVLGVDSFINIDNVFGTQNNDTLIGNSLDNLLRGGRGDDILNGGDGIDTADYSDANIGGVEIDLNMQAQFNNELGNDTLISIENVIGSRFGDTLISGVDNIRNIMMGMGGDDIFRLNSLDGDDVFDGGSGLDAIEVGEGIQVGLEINLMDGVISDSDIQLISIESVAAGGLNDTIVGSNDDNRLLGRDGNDSIDALSGNDYIDGDVGHDTLFGREGDDTLFGSDGDNIFGGSGLDTLHGGDGDDFIDGGSHDDQLHGGLGNDTLIGDEGSDLLNGQEDNDTLDGGEGDDTINGGSGLDIIVADFGNDVIDGDDEIEGIDGNDTLYGDAGSDSMLGGVGNDNIYGGAEDDTIDGGDDNDLIEGQGGDDSLTGGQGNDFFIFSYNGEALGQDTITDFGQADTDFLVLENLGDFSTLDTNADDVIDENDDSASLVDGHLVLTVLDPNDSNVTAVEITLMNVTSLTEDDFSFQ